MRLNAALNFWPLDLRTHVVSSIKGVERKATGGMALSAPSFNQVRRSSSASHLLSATTFSFAYTDLL
jgi:hypothetical protein